MSTQKKRYDIVMLSTAHRAIDNRIFHREAKTLMKAGLSVCVIGPHTESEYLDGIFISALPKPKNRMHRLILGRTLLRRAFEISGKLYIFHDPELIWVAILLRMAGKKVVFDCHEKLPAQVLQKHWIPKPLRWILAPATWLGIRLGAYLLSGLIAVYEAMARLSPPDRTVVVKNFPEREALDVSCQGEPVHLRRNIVVYAGLISRIRGISELVDAFRELQGVAELWLVGEFDNEDFQRQIIGSLPPNVVWLGWKEAPELFKLYQQTKIGVHIPYPTKNHRHTMPTKMFQYLGSGLPMIASNFPEWTKVIDGCGIQVNPYDVGQIRDAVRRLVSNNSLVASMSAAGRDRVAKYFNWEQDGKKLVAFCSKLIGQKQPSDSLNSAKDPAFKLFNAKSGPGMPSLKTPALRQTPLPQPPESRD